MLDQSILKDYCFRIKNLLKKYPKYYRDFENFFDHSSKDYKERKKLLAHFVFQNKNIDKVVVGFDNCKQLKDLIKVLDNNFNLNYKQISSFKKKNINLIDPRYWINI